MNDHHVLLTGGTGFLGRYVLAELCQRDYCLRILKRKPQAYINFYHFPDVYLGYGCCDG